MTVRLTVTDSATPKLAALADRLPQPKRNATIRKMPGTSSENAHRLAEHIKDRDANPISVPTPLGTWTSGKGGTSQTAYTTPPVPITAKRKYRRQP